MGLKRYFSTTNYSRTFLDRQLRSNPSYKTVIDIVGTSEVMSRVPSPPKIYEDDVAVGVMLDVPDSAIKVVCTSKRIAT